MKIDIDHPDFVPPNWRLQLLQTETVQKAAERSRPIEILREEHHTGACVRWEPITPMPTGSAWVRHIIHGGQLNPYLIHRVKPLEELDPITPIEAAHALVEKRQLRSEKRDWAGARIESIFADHVYLDMFDSPFDYQELLDECEWVTDSLTNEDPRIGKEKEKPDDDRK